MTACGGGAKVFRSVAKELRRRASAASRDHTPGTPEARGRSERMFGTLQDRLVKELEHAGIDDVETANRWIREVYLPQLASPSRRRSPRWLSCPSMPAS
jgi:hypothetical protein